MRPPSFSFFIFLFSMRLLFLISPFLLSGCFLVRPFAGADVDQEQLRAAREAKVAEVRLQGAERLARRLAQPDPVGNADLTFYFSEALLNKTAAQLDGSTGWLDSLTSYNIRSVRVKLYNGSAIATISMAAFQHEYDVDVDLLMDCLLTFAVDSGRFYARLEPFNIVPAVKASGVIASMEGIIQDILSIKLSTLNDYLPPIQFPVDFQNRFPVPANRIEVRSGINMDITTPAQQVLYSLAVKEALIVTGKVVVALNVKHAGVER